ncbi:hypothetical protein [Serratia sp. M24T3]|uniref:hypothetical protein n=1 Tax=Serratia sp. M24T3 TaxID=932213 RepID=UPI001ED94363|nr:hypothetical protein [Serratia sp. M24T3]
MEISYFKSYVAFWAMVLKKSELNLISLILEIELSIKKRAINKNFIYPSLIFHPATAHHLTSTAYSPLKLTYTAAN